MVNKHGEISTPWLIAIAVIVILVLDIGGAGTYVKGKLGMTGTTAPAPTVVPVSPGQAAKCYIEDTTVSIGPAEQRYKPTTKASTSYHRVIKNNVDKGLYLDGSTFTANPGDKLEIYYAINDSKGQYYASKQMFTVPCAGEVTTAEAPDSDAYQLFKMDSNNLTKQVFNWNNGNINSLTDNMTLGAGDKKANALKLYGTYQEGSSPYGKLAVVVFANASTYSKIIIGNYPTISKPMHTSNPSIYGSDVTSWVYELPGIRSNEAVETTLNVEVKSSPGDSTVLARDGNRIQLWFVDQDWYQDTITGKMTFGYEDNDYTDVGQEDFNISVSVG